MLKLRTKSISCGVRGGIFAPACRRGKENAEGFCNCRPTLWTLKILEVSISLKNLS
jgi:hypothetical protein